MQVTGAWLAAAVGGRLTSGDAGAVIGRVETDSRRVGPGDLFVALRGPRFDGRAFAGEALARGAMGVMVGGGPWTAPAPAGGVVPVVIEVSDAIEALQRFAAAVRRAVSTTVVAITGSAGKTTTKETIAALLSGSFRVVKNEGNLNNHIGLPLSLLRLREAPDVAVMELGMNHAGEISALVAIADPDVRVWTNVGDAHLGFFSSSDALADAKAEILERAEPRDLLVCNADDPLVMARAGRFTGRVATFGCADVATICAHGVEDLGVSGVRARMATPAGTRAIETPLLGRGNLANVLAATAVALDFGLGLDTIVERISALRPADRRGVVHRLRRGVVLVDDSYNSSPSALRTVLDVVRADRSSSRKVAVLGEMLELGDHATALHQEIGRVVAGVGFDRLFVVGGSAGEALAGAAAAGMAPGTVAYYRSSDEAAEPIASAIEPGDLVLVKGSRGTRTDRVADRIVAEWA